MIKLNSFFKTINVVTGMDRKNWSFGIKSPWILFKRFNCINLCLYIMFTYIYENKYMKITQYIFSMEPKCSISLKYCNTAFFSQPVAPLCPIGLASRKGPLALTPAQPVSPATLHLIEYTELHHSIVTNRRSIQTRAVTLKQ